jgi:hypothetical protein
MPKVDEFLKKVRVVLCGREPGMIQQKMNGEQTKPPGGKKGQHATPEQEAINHAHWTGTGKNVSLAIPWVAVYRSICSAASDFKAGGRKNMSTLVAATISCETPLISLKTNKYEVFAEFVRIPPRTGAMVRVGRPLIKDWRAEFIMSVDSEMYAHGDVGCLRAIIEQAGKMVGLGAWRPQLKGPYGRFFVEVFEIL